jgi:hypothetical protein
MRQLEGDLGRIVSFFGLWRQPVGQDYDVVDQIRPHHSLSSEGWIHAESGLQVFST